MNVVAGASFGLASPPVVYKNPIIAVALVQETPIIGTADDTRAWDALASWSGRLIELRQAMIYRRKANNAEDLIQLTVDGGKTSFHGAKACFHPEFHLSEIPAQFGTENVSDVLHSLCTGRSGESC